MAYWTRLPQERKDQDYFFSGTIYVTQGIQAELTQEEISWIILDVKNFARSQEKGIDYLQIYQRDDGFKVYVIDQLTKAQVASGDFQPGDNHATLLLRNEYWHWL